VWGLGRWGEGEKERDGEMVVGEWRLGTLWPSHLAVSQHGRKTLCGKTLLRPYDLYELATCPKSGHFKEMFTLRDFQPQNRIIVMTISTISMCQNHSISFVLGGGGRGDN
jgi:hypothetical protein